jgi:tetratricopeptide (TPR) repeat protein
LAILAAYSNSLSGPFIFDDRNSIYDNPTIRHLWAIGSVLSPPGGGIAVQNRPVVNLSLAINYALGGEQVLGYHLFNLAVHIIAALTLLGAVRRTLRLPAFADRFGSSATWYGTAVALLWGLHPLATEAVTYTIQRTESMFSMFYLLTLYCAIRGYGAARAQGWFAAAIGSCLLGMGCKEPMVSAPLLVLLYDRLFVTRSWKEVFQRHWGLYLGLAATWILPGLPMTLGSGSRGATAGFGAGMTWWEYARTQFWAICRYLRLAFWPTGLVVDYGTWIARASGEIVPGAIVVTLLVMATLAAYVRRPWAGYLGTWFFAILAPSSSVLPVVTETVAEKRMYLPLAAVTALVVFAGGAAGKRLVDRLAWPEPLRRRRAGALAVGVVACAAVALGVLTVLRNRDYRSELAIWEDAIRKRPANPRAYINRANAYRDLGAWDKEIADRDTVIEFRPNDADAYNDRALAYSHAGACDRAVQDFTKAIALKPDFAAAYTNRAEALNALGQYAQAIRDCDKAIELKPGFAQPYVNRGNAYGAMGDRVRALADYSRAIELQPDLSSAYNNRGAMYLLAGAYDRAVRDFTKAIELKPDYVNAYRNRASAYYNLKDYEKAWADVKALETLGAKPPPQLLKLLTQARAAQPKP